MMGYANRSASPAAHKATRKAKGLTVRLSCETILQIAVTHWISAIFKDTSMNCHIA